MSLTFGGQLKLQPLLFPQRLTVWAESPNPLIMALVCPLIISHPEAVWGLLNYQPSLWHTKDFKDFRSCMPEKRDEEQIYIA